MFKIKLEPFFALSCGYDDQYGECRLAIYGPKREGRLPTGERRSSFAITLPKVHVVRYSGKRAMNG